MDVSARGIRGRVDPWYAWLVCVLLLGAVVRLHGIHNPLLDHPGWRQGDTAAIARNFATLDFNPLHPQADYNGPPPNYVELEFQFVPLLAAGLYKVFGIHEIFGRLIPLAFSLANVVLVAYFGRWLFGSRLAGAIAAFTFAVFPGSVYYGRTFMPDTAMVCFSTAAAFAAARWLVDGGARFGRGFWSAAALCALAILAKPVALVVLVPVVATMFARLGPSAVRRPQCWAFLAVALIPYAVYDAYLRGIAEWHWASGITEKHVVPELRVAFASFGGFDRKLGAFRDALGMLPATMLGPFGTTLALAGALAPLRPRSRTFVYAWLGALLAYTFTVVTVEHVDYYLYPFLPLAALWIGGVLARLWEAPTLQSAPWRRSLAAGFILLGIAAFSSGHAAVRQYYFFSRSVYASAKALDSALPPGSLIVMAHYDPSVLYYINRKGWEEDPYLWTPFDEQSAIRKGARYLISVEDRRLHRNAELCHWLERFPLLPTQSRWPVYQTDPAKAYPGAEVRWQNFRATEKRGRLLPCVLRQRE